MRKTNKDDCRCRYLVDLTRQKDVFHLDEVFTQAVKEMLVAESVSIHEPHSLTSENLSSADVILDIARGSGMVAKLLISNNAETADTQHLQELLEVYSNQYHHIYRSTQDMLTRLLNRTAFDERMQRLFGPRKHHRKKDERRAMAILDVDHFKKINDTYGHLYGDEILILLANMMQETFRADDWLFRYGGEEFVIILNDTDLITAEMVVDRFRTAVESRNFPQIGRVTISAGLTQIFPSKGLTSTIAEADQALYYSKDTGRNQVSVFRKLIEAGIIDDSNSFGGELELF
ncbi:MAG: GGDEF domain-containing protein [Pseudomonadales bacterium]|nr:GGDEF domain-containing protein [Pseudomonadales bacterium]